MNRYKAGGPSRTSATTVCQKCLKKGHYSYECTASQQDRPYNSRPSRTQQLLNPKLAPKITNEVPMPQEDGKASRKRSLEEDNGRERPSSPSKRARSVSSDSDSVSTISTRSSRSPLPGRRSQQDRKERSRQREAEKGGSRVPQRIAHQRSRSPDRAHIKAQSPSSAQHPYRSDSRRESDQRRRASPPVDRNPNREQDACAKVGTAGYRSRSPYRGRRGTQGQSDHQKTQRPLAMRERSLSPYSRRVALTQAGHGD